jgi:hypothetical protein
VAILKSTQKIALCVSISVLLMSGFTQARDWRWYPRKAPKDSGALRPDLEGVKGDDAEQRGLSELEEMRQWLRQRDEDRRQQGITVPDTVEQMEPAGDVTARKRQWPERPVPGLGADPSFGDIMQRNQSVNEQSERVRDTLYPQSSGQRHSYTSRHRARQRYSTSSRRFTHQRSGSNRKQAKGSHKRRH